MTVRRKQRVNGVFVKALRVFPLVVCAIGGNMVWATESQTVARAVSVLGQPKAETAASAIERKGIQRFESADGRITLVLCWDNRTFSKSVKAVSLRIGTGSDNRESVTMKAASSSGSSALGESVTGKRIRVHSNAGCFAVDGSELELTVTEGACAESEKKTRLKFAENGMALVGVDSASPLKLVAGGQK